MGNFKLQIGDSMANFHGGVEWPDGIDPFKMGFMANIQQGGECITQQGLQFLANHQYGAGEWATRTEILSEEEGSQSYSRNDAVA